MSEPTIAAARDRDLAGPAYPGSSWWYSATAGWRQLDDGIANANGPVVLDVDGGRYRGRPERRFRLS